jgi:hypothetical protein
VGPVGHRLGTVHDRPEARRPRRKHHMSEGFEIGSLHPGKPFDYGAGFIDPGLIIAPEDADYIAFLCSLPQISPEDVRAATGAACQAPLASPADLNLPSITVSELRGSLSVRRRVIRGEQHGDVPLLRSAASRRGCHGAARVV